MAWSKHWGLFFSIWISNYAHIICWKDSLFLSELLWHLCWKLVDPIYVWVYFCLSPLLCLYFSVSPSDSCSFIHKVRGRCLCHPMISAGGAQRQHPQGSMQGYQTLSWMSARDWIRALSWYSRSPAFALFKVSKFSLTKWRLYMFIPRSHLTLELSALPLFSFPFSLSPVLTPEGLWGREQRCQSVRLFTGGTFQKVF